MQTKDVPPVGFVQLFRFASSWDRLLIFIGIVTSMSSGAIFPWYVITFGVLIQSFVDTENEIDGNNFCNTTQSADLDGWVLQYIGNGGRRLTIYAIQ
jgi:hypothetical protein